MWLWPVHTSPDYSLGTACPTGLWGLMAPWKVPERGLGAKSSRMERQAGLRGQEVGSGWLTCPPFPGTNCRLRTPVRQDPEEGLGSGQLCHWFALNLNPSFLFPQRG